MSGHLVTTKRKQHYYPLGDFDSSVSLGVESIVRLPFCLPFPEFVCCLREAITAASKRLITSGSKEKQQETIEGFCASSSRNGRCPLFIVIRLLSAGRILLYLFLQNTVNLGGGSRACLYSSKSEEGLGAYSVLQQQISPM